MEEKYIVSARKYRPTDFHSVIGQKALTETLKNAIMVNKLAHAYLFCGPRGVGKTTCARIFAKTINCENRTPEGEACNQCESCRAFNENRSLNVNELDAASNNSVNDIRTLTEKVLVRPQIGKYCVYIIDEVHMLTKEAFNAFLKTLEEPPAHAIFILATTEKHKILPTILSRCQIYDFNRITINDMVDHLRYVAGNEGVTADSASLNLIAKKADGALRDALSIFDQVVSYCGNNLTYERVAEDLNVLNTDYYFRLVDCLREGDITHPLLIFDEILRKGFDAQQFVVGLASHIRDIMMCKDNETVKLLEVSEDMAAHYIEQAKNTSNAFIFKAFELAMQCDLDYRLSKNKRLLIELMLVRLSQLLKPIVVDNSAQTNKIAKIVVPAAGNTPIQAAPTAGVQIVTPKKMNPTTLVQKPTDAPKATLGKRVSLETPKETVVKTEVVAETPTQLRTKPYDNVELIRAWKMVAELCADKNYLNTLMNNYLPSKDGNLCVAKVISKHQQDSLTKEAALVQKLLRDTLENDEVTLAISVDESIVDGQVFTMKDKLKVMKEHNPNLEEFCKTLNLEL